MKKRNIIAVFSALACLALLPNAQAAPAPETPDPGSVVGSLNTADGDRALQGATAVSLANSAFGAFSMFSLTTGTFNTAVGTGALDLNNGDANTAVGAAALLLNTGSANTAAGASAGINNTTGSNNIYVGDSGVDGESNVIAIGGIPSSGTAYTDVFIGGVFGTSVSAVTAVPVFVDTDGHLGTVLVADAPSRQGTQPQAMLNKSDHRKLQQLQATVARQQKEIAMLTTQLKEQAAQIQKVSAQLEVSKPAPRTVANK